LEGWIKHFRNDGGEGRREPLRLAHLLLAKAAYLSEGSDDSGKFEFPSTVVEFLHNDPTKDQAFFGEWVQKSTKLTPPEII